MKKIFTLSVFLLCAILSFSQTIQLDESFNSGGLPPGSIIENVDNVDSATALIVQQDGNLVVAGNSNLNQVTLVRYKIDGTKDLTFGVGGVVKTTVGNYCNVYAIALQQDGKIVVAGYSGDENGNDLLIIRYHSTGLLDQTFGSSGIFKLHIGAYDIVNGIAVDNNSNIFFVGEANFHVLIGKVNNVGALQNFGGSTGFILLDVPDLENESANAICIREADNSIFFAGKVGVANKDILVGGYDEYGFPLGNFGVNGLVLTDISNEDIANCIILTSSNILVGGSSILGGDHNFSLVKYNMLGQTVSDFGTSGIASTNINLGSDDFPYSIDLQKDGDIMLGGSTLLGSELNYAVVRYNSNGVVDPTFDGDGKVTVNIGRNVSASEMRLSNYRIYIAGTTSLKDFSVIALLNSELALPIQLKSFIAENTGSAVELTWSTSSETNASVFEIERSVDGKNFVRIGQVATAANSNSFKSYQFSDFKPSVINHYRLKMIDLDGKVAFSKVVVVRNGASARFEVNPNPVQSTLQVTIPDPSVSRLTIYSSAGILVQVVNLPSAKGKRIVPIDASGLIRGTYFIKAGTHSVSFTKL